jgi:ribonucleoside-diphosphate reductase alpha chain/ribonucleoside-triphosphate reductase
MQIVQVPSQRRFRLTESFLAPYRAKKDPFQTLLARSSYLTKYCRGDETWTDTIRRVIEGNASLVAGVAPSEMEALFHLFWTGQSLPPGRSLWVGGIDGIPADARYNCWYTTLRGIDDWCWAANQLMLGGGVGIGLGEIRNIPAVADVNSRFAVWCKTDHENYDEVLPESKSFLNGSTPVFVVPDSREGWVEALRVTLRAAFEGRDQIVDVSNVRRRGLPIKTFGGVACGPGPLTNMLRAAWKLVRGARGRCMTSVECLDVTNHIGLCIKSGNVRRSALIALGDADDADFRNAKKDWEKVLSHRHTSNNSIVFRTKEAIRDFDWHGLVNDVSEFGEPGIANMPLVWETDPDAKGVNPCGEQFLHDREACNLAEIFPGNFEAVTDKDLAFKLITRYTLRQRMTPLLDPQSHEVGQRNMRLGVSLGGICDFEWTPAMLSHWFRVVRQEANNYADELGVAHPITVTTVKPSGTISLLNGSSPGIHAPFAPYYIRRIRIAKNDLMVGSLYEAGVPFEEDVYDKTGNTWVFAFPMKARHTRVTVQSQTLRDQLERQAIVQEHWADNAVSSTISFTEEERETLAAHLKEFVPRLKSTSVLPRKHGYAQAPYEVTDEKTYMEMLAQINHEHPLSKGGDLMDDGGDCAGGSCPLR